MRDMGFIRSIGEVLCSGWQTVGLRDMGFIRAIGEEMCSGWQTVGLRDLGFTRAIDGVMCSGWQTVWSARSGTGYSHGATRDYREKRFTDLDKISVI